MRLLAIPVKSLERAKGRLSPVLSTRERAALSLAMMEQVLEACIQQDGWQVLVVTRDLDAGKVASTWGVPTLREEGRSLLRAVRQVERSFPDSRGTLAVVLADLPHLTATALRAALGSDAEAAVVAAPAESDGGTNLLVRRPPTVVEAKFGRSSFSRHRAEAYRAGVTFSEVRSPEVAFDLDRPADLVRLSDSDRPCRALTICREMGLGDRLRARV